jgi:RimJ/RimL family protein N-acetyltransferase
VAAIRAYEKAGFSPVGVMRRSERDVGGDGWHDSLLMELLAGEESQAPRSSTFEEDSRARRG